MKARVVNNTDCSITTPQSTKTANNFNNGWQADWNGKLRPGWPDVFVKKSPKDNEKSPKKSPNHVFVRFTIWNCFTVTLATSLYHYNLLDLSRTSLPRLILVSFTLVTKGEASCNLPTISFSFNENEMLWKWLPKQGMLKGEVLLYSWPPVWLVWNQLYDNWQILFLFAKQTNPDQSNRRSMVHWYFPL
jgi:hypothetical protein